MSYGLLQITKAPLMAVSLQLATSHMRLTLSDSDPQNEAITHYIKTATELVESWTSRTLTPTTYDYTLDGFPYIYNEMQPVLWGKVIIPLPRAPVTAVSNVWFKNFDGVETAFTDYDVDTSQEPGQIFPLPLAVWPLADLQRAKPVRIRFSAGYTAENIPHRAKQAVLYLVSHMYEYREPVTPQQLNTLPLGFRETINSLKYRFVV